MKKILLLLFLPFVISLTSCGDKNKTSGEKKDVPNKDAKNESSTLENEVKKETSDQNTLTEADKTKSNELGMTPGLPSTFPADVPQPKNSKTLGSLNSSEGTIVTFESTDKVPEIISFYKEEMGKNGYTIVEGEESLVSDKGGLINWKKDNKVVGIMLSYDKDRNISSLVITYK